MRQQVFRPLVVPLASRDQVGWGLVAASFLTAAGIDQDLVELVGACRFQFRLGIQHRFDDGVQHHFFDAASVVTILRVGKSLTGFHFEFLRDRWANVVDV